MRKIVKKTNLPDLNKMSRSELSSVKGGDTRYEIVRINGEWVLVEVEDK